MDGNRMITASEIGEYTYCRRSWWFHRVKGIASGNAEALIEGMKAHVVHGRSVRMYRTMQRIALALLFLAAIFLTAWALGVAR